MMERCRVGVEPTRAGDNWTRSRHAFDVQLWDGHSVGQIHQVWKDLGSVHDYRPCQQSESPWFGPAHAHGYGSHYIEDRDGKPFLFFDEVTEQKQVNGLYVPYRTEILFRQLDETRTRAIGPKGFALKVTEFDNPQHSFKAARRSIGGFLIEGPHLIEANVGGVEYYLMLFSAGDAFTDQYGSHYAYRRKADGLDGPFTPGVDVEGELINITKSLSDKIDATWGIGRPNPFRDEQGNLWIAAHAILKQDIPDGETKSGWPPTYDELVKRARRSLLIPITIEMRDGRPLVKVTETGD
jgi:beta-xylosidase